MTSGNPEHLPLHYWGLQDPLPIEQGGKGHSAGLELLSHLQRFFLLLTYGGFFAVRPGNKPGSVTSPPRSLLQTDFCGLAPPLNGRLKLPPRRRGR